jgi:hypothetical protein
MKTLQFELWRLLATIGLFGAAMGCFVVQRDFRSFVWFYWLAGLFLLAGAIGTPFRRGFYLVHRVQAAFIGVCLVLVVLGFAAALMR